MTKDTVPNTIAFLRMAAVELRRLADRERNTAAELRHTADQCLQEAEALSNVIGGASAGDSTRPTQDYPRRAMGD